MEDCQCGSQNHPVCHKAGWKFTSTVYDKCEIKLVRQVVCFVSFLNSQLGWVHLFEIIQKLPIIKIQSDHQYIDSIN